MEYSKGGGERNRGRRHTQPERERECVCVCVSQSKQECVKRIYVLMKSSYVEKEKERLDRIK